MNRALALSSQVAPCTAWPLNEVLRPRLIQASRRAPEHLFKSLMSTYVNICLLNGLALDHRDRAYVAYPMTGLNFLHVALACALSPPQDTFWRLNPIPNPIVIHMGDGLYWSEWANSTNSCCIGTAEIPSTHSCMRHEQHKQTLSCLIRKKQTLQK
ncbi:hypothetical protein C4D60_Mb06t08710 [Musa balbisiana]|uniref:Uncharacterized protein n=1 Tax=Musa balbisiana TaxID=52838 RepID=A0A4S8ILM9_MUSBA|nr:hypothetical protein C4D60_Mb06t08710 [Musa balbisiana]